MPGSLTTNPDRLPSSRDSGPHHEYFDDLQSLIHAATSNTARITGRNPVIVPMSRYSPFSTYANLDLEASMWEKPWDIVMGIEKSRNNLVDLRSSSESTGLENIRSSRQKEINYRYSGMVRKSCRGGYNMKQINLPASGRYPRMRSRDPRLRKVSGASKVSGLSRELRDKNVRTPWVHRVPHNRILHMHVFADEIQNIMYSFGEVRYCSTDVLEFIEDAVRSITQRVALGILSRFNTETLTVYNISTCIRHDPSALHRLLFSLLRSKVRGENLRIVKPVHRDWDSFLHHATIHGIKVGEYPSLKLLEHIPVVKVHKMCIEKARSNFWRMLGALFKLQNIQSLQSSLTDRDSRCPTEGVGSRRRIDLFREWLALPDYVQMSEGCLHSLGNLAREAIGIITQTALVLRDRSTPFHSYEQLLVRAIGYGIGAGVLLPLSGLQTFELLNVLESMEDTEKEKQEWIIRGGQKENALEVKYLKEAWRTLDNPEALAAHKPFWIGF